MAGPGICILCWGIPAHLGEPNVQSCYTLSIYVSYHVFVYGLLVCGVGAGFGSTSPAFMRSSASHPAGPHDWLAKKVNRAPIAGVGGFDTICTAVCNRSDSSPACRLCRLEPTRAPNCHRRCSVSTFLSCRDRQNLSSGYVMLMT